ncbi:MAG TPA: hypothetical protein VFJ14_17885 [Nocardioidaceae bacterium]|nr:hypothetical protein [Nocardioidaceae bacterium]
MTDYTITGPLSDTAGNPLQYRNVIVTAASLPTHTVDTEIVAPGTVKTDADGNFTVDLPVNGDTNPFYVVVVGTSRWTIRSAVAGSWHVGDPAIQVAVLAGSWTDLGVSHDEVTDAVAAEAALRQAADASEADARESADAAHAALTTDVHGIVDTSQLATHADVTTQTAAVQAAVDAEADRAEGVEGSLRADLTSETAARVSGDAAAVQTADLDTAGHPPTLDSGGKLRTAQLPSLAITEVHVVASQAEMLTLSAQTGDVAVRTDQQRNWILQGSDPSALADWVELAVPPDAVSSVDGRTGAVDLSDLYTSATDPRLTDARTPTAHAATHATGGTDPVTPASIGAATAADLTAEVARAEAAEALLIPTAQRGVAGGVASLDAAGRVPAGQLATGIGYTSYTDQQVSQLQRRLAALDLPGATAYWRADVFDGAKYPDLTGHGLDLLVPSGSAAPTRLVYSGSRYLWLPAANGSGVASIGAVDASGGLDVRVRMSSAWAPATNQTIIGQWGNAGAYGWQLGFNYVLKKLHFGASPDGTAATWAYSSIVGLPVGSPVWIRVTWTPGGAVAFFWSIDGQTWTAFGTGTVAATIMPSPAPLGVGAIYTSAGSPNGAVECSIYAAQVLDNNTNTLASWSAEDMSQTGGTSGGRVWTINRSTSGSKAALVDRTITLLDGVDDYLYSPDNPLLNFGASQDFTVLWVGRIHSGATNGVLVGTGPAAGPGWRLTEGASTPLKPSARLTDGTTPASAAAGTTATADKLAMMHMRRSGGALGAGVDGDTSGATASAATDTTQTAGLRLGSYTDAANFAAFEWHSAAIVRRALTDAELLTASRVLTAPFDR